MFSIKVKMHVIRAQISSGLAFSPFKYKSFLLELKIQSSVNHLRPNGMTEGRPVLGVHW